MLNDINSTKPNKSTENAKLEENPNPTRKLSQSSDSKNPQYEKQRNPTPSKLSPGRSNLRANYPLKPISHTAVIKCSEVTELPHIPTQSLSLSIPKYLSSAKQKKKPNSTEIRDPPFPHSMPSASLSRSAENEEYIGMDSLDPSIPPSKGMLKAGGGGGGNYNYRMSTNMASTKILEVPENSDSDSYGGNRSFRRASSLVMEKEDEDKEDDMFSEEGSKFSDNMGVCQKQISVLLDSTLWSIFMTIITIYALFFDDIRIIAFAKNTDDYFYAITTFCLVCFTAEIIMASYATKHYFNSFFFWLDIIATASLITDIGWIMGDGESGLLASMGDLAKSARAGRAARVIRIVRLIRLVRIVKLYKQAKHAKEKVERKQNADQEERESMTKFNASARALQHAATVQVQPRKRMTFVGNLFPEGNRDDVFISPRVADIVISDSKESVENNMGENGDGNGNIEQVTVISARNKLLLGVPEGIINNNPGGSMVIQNPSQNVNPSNIVRPGQAVSRLSAVLPSKVHKIRRSYSLNNLPVIRKWDTLDDESELGSPRNNPQLKSISPDLEMRRSSPNHKTPKATDPSPRKSRRNEKDQADPSTPQSSARRVMTGASCMSMASMEGGEEEIKIPKESRVSKKLSELTTKRVVILILAMLFCLPWFLGETYYVYSTSYEYGLFCVHQIYETTGNNMDYTLSYEAYYREHKNDDRFPLLYLRAIDKETYQKEDLDDLRYAEYVQIEYSDSQFMSAIDQRYIVKFDAWLNIGRTLFVCIVLSIGSIFFNYDANTLVLMPIERMIEKVKAIAKNPLLAQEDMSDAGILSTMKKEQDKSEYLSNSMDGEAAALAAQKNDEKNSYETDILEKTILKIGRLLALGFGEAGSKIIADNMAKGGDVNPMIPGSKIFAIFGFCDIRKFANVTEALETDVFKFVNQIASIVHMSIHHCNGSANKNLGDSFFLVWKFLPSSWEQVEISAPSEKSPKFRASVSISNNSFIKSSESGSFSTSELSETVQELVLKKNAFDVRLNADLAVLSFIKIISKIHKMSDMLEYRKDPRLKNKIPGFAVNMGFGLHMGWAIEGAIGSYYKIDASYLSPNVNIAARVKAATAQYGVQMLMSGQIQELLSVRVKTITREIDTVTVKGSTQPIHLFTIDLDTNYLIIKPRKLKAKTRSTITARNKKFMGNLQNGRITTTTLFVRAHDLKTMRSHIPSRFFVNFKRGYNYYIDGQWKESYKYLQRALELRPHDGPSITLCNYLDSKNCMTPQGWEGYRVLTSK